jgi:hypothetical protein
MPELLEGLEQLARERDDSLQRASKELIKEPEGFLIAVRETCKLVETLSDFWDVMGLMLRRGGVSAKRLLRACDMLVQMSDYYSDFLGRAVEEWPERNLPGERVETIYADTLSARKRLDALMEDVRKTRERAAMPPRISADPEELKQRIKQADEGGKWMNLTDAVSQIRQGGPPRKE